MYFEKDDIYHIYNMGNNSQPIFFSEENYRFFLRKIENEIKPVCDIIAYCLMPNHYHLMVKANEGSVKNFDNSNLQLLSRKIGTLQSSYTQAINKQYGTSGSVFRQKAKAKSLSQVFLGAERYFDYALSCFVYIHQNPLKAGLVKRIKDWEFSSFQEYSSANELSICNKPLALEVLGIEKEKFKGIFYRETSYEL